MNKPKLITVLVVAVLALIILLQNTATVETRILFFTISLPRALLLLITGLTGFAAGAFVAWSIMKRRAV